MAVLVGKAHDLVFDRGAVARTLAVDHAAIDRGEMQVVFDQLMGCCRGAGDVAAHLFAAAPGGGVKREEAVRSVAGLLLQLIEGDAAPIHPCWGAGFESVGVESKLLQGFSEPFGGLLTGPSCGHRLVAHPDASAKKGAGREHHGFGSVKAAEIGAHTGDACGWTLARVPGLSTASGIAFDLQPCDHRLTQGQVGGVLQQLQHLA